MSGDRPQQQDAMNDQAAQQAQPEAQYRAAQVGTGWGAGIAGAGQGMGTSVDLGATASAGTGSQGNDASRYGDGQVSRIQSTDAGVVTQAPDLTAFGADFAGRSGETSRADSSRLVSSGDTSGWVGSGTGMPLDFVQMLLGQPDQPSMPGRGQPVDTGPPGDPTEEPTEQGGGGGPRDFQEPPGFEPVRQMWSENQLERAAREPGRNPSPEGGVADASGPKADARDLRQPADDDRKPPDDGEPASAARGRGDATDSRDMDSGRTPPDARAGDGAWPWHPGDAQPGWDVPERPHFDRTDGDARRDQPAIKDLVNFVKDSFGPGLRPGRTYDPTKTGEGVPSRHMAGRAADIRCNSKNPELKAKGDALLDALTRNNALLARSMGIQQILWNRQVWDARSPELGVHPMNAAKIESRKLDPHTDHFHLELNKAGAHYQTSFWRQAGLGGR